MIIVPMCSVHASAHEFCGLGPRATGMGGAFIGVADDWTAPYWNPAGLTQTVGNGFGVALLHPNYTAIDGNSIANPDIANMSFDQGDIFIQSYPVEPTSFERTEVTGSFYQPFVGGFLDLKGIKFGGGFYIPVGNWVDWKDTIPDPTDAEISASYYTKMYLMVGNLSVAKEIIPGLSLGAGLNLLYLKNQYQAEKSYKGSTNPFFIDYDFKYITKGNGTGFEGTFGVLYNPLPVLSVGAIYRTGSELSLDGSGEYSYTLPLPQAESSNYTEKFRHPTTYGIGAAFSPMPNLLITADWQGTKWSTWKTDIVYETVGVGLRNQDTDWGWKSTDRIRLGGELNVTEEIALRAGYYTDESPAPDPQVSLTNINDVDRRGVTFGAGYEVRRFHFDLVYEYLWGEREVNDVEYSIKVYAITLALYYHL